MSTTHAPTDHTDVTMMQIVYVKRVYLEHTSSASLLSSHY